MADTNDKVVFEQAVERLGGVMSVYIEYLRAIHRHTNRLTGEEIDWLNQHGAPQWITAAATAMTASKHC